MALVSITRLRLRSWRFLPGFVLYAIRSNLQCRKAQGNRGMQFLNERPLVFWTATAWDSEADMKRYMSSGSHGRAMPHLMHWCDEAAVVRWTQDTVALPSWQEAHRRMQSEGRRSKVRHPTPAQERFEIPAPPGK